MSRKKRDIFNQTITRLGDPIVIREEKTGPELGCCSERDMTITIDPNQPKAGKFVVLIHELMHLTDSQLIRTGIRKRRVEHDWIGQASGNLLILMVAAGLIRDLTLEDLAELYEGQGEPKTARVGAQ